MRTENHCLSVAKVMITLQCVYNVLCHSLLQSGYHSGQKCVTAEVKLQILQERMAGRNDTKLIQELKRKEQDLLSVASIEVRDKVLISVKCHLLPFSEWHIMIICLYAQHYELNSLLSSSESKSTQAIHNMCMVLDDLICLTTMSIKSFVSCHLCSERVAAHHTGFEPLNLTFI